MMHSVLAKTFSGLETNGSSGPCGTSAFGFLPIALRFTKNFKKYFITKRQTNAVFLSSVSAEVA